MSDDNAILQAMYDAYYDDTDADRPEWRGLSGILDAIRKGEVPVPDEAPQIVALRREVAQIGLQLGQTAMDELDAMRREAEANTRHDMAMAEVADLKRELQKDWEANCCDLMADVQREKARADEMKADGGRAVLEERNRTAKAAAERDRLAALLIESNRLLKDAKRHLGPHTTNSDADTAIARNDAALAEIGGGK